MASLDVFERAACELLRALRGKRSQVAFARRLGYRGNPLTDWEHGRRYPTAPEALRVAARARIDVARAFAAFAPAPVPSAREGYSVAAWLSTLRGSTPIVDVARRADRSRYRVTRWLSGQSVPRLPDFLRLVEAISGRAAEWVAGLVPIASVPSLNEPYTRLTAARRLATELPWSEAVLRVLETDAYRALGAHSDDFLARTLGIDTAEVQAVTSALMNAGVVAATPHGFKVMAPLVVDTKADPTAARRLRQHWAEVAARRAREDHDDWFAYNVISVSRADAERIEQRLRAVYREIRGIVRESSPSEQAALLTVQLVRWRPGK